MKREESGCGWEVGQECRKGSLCGRTKGNIDSFFLSLCRDNAFKEDVTLFQFLDVTNKNAMTSMLL
jgi:hypothetical protein